MISTVLNRVDGMIGKLDNISRTLDINGKDNEYTKEQRENQLYNQTINESLKETWDNDEDSAYDELDKDKEK